MNTPSAPGWYDDPEHADQLRYYDGVVWTKHTAPRRTRAVTPSPTPYQPTPPSQPAQQPPASDPYGWRTPVDQQPPQQQPPNQWPPQQQPPPQQQQPSPQQWPPQQPTQPPQQQWPPVPAPQQQWSPPQQWPHQPPQQNWPAQQWQGQGPGVVPRGPTTPDGVPLASYWQRVGAYLLDGLIQGVLSLVLGGYFLWRGLRPWFEDFSAAIENNDTAALENLSNTLGSYLVGSDMALFLGISLVIGLVYNVGFLVRRGATPGKMAVRISVRERERPGPLTPFVALRRYSVTLLASLLSLVPGAAGLVGSLLALADLLWPAWDSKRQAIHDKVAGTNVVQGRQPPRGR